MKKNANISIEFQDNYYINEDLNYYKSRPDNNIKDYFNIVSITIFIIKYKYYYYKFPFKNLLYSYLENSRKERSRR